MATKYQPVIDHLAARSETVVTLTFAEIEALIGSPLTETMLVDASQWNDRESSAAWRMHELGWRVRLDRRNGRVQFAREAEGGGNGVG